MTGEFHIGARRFIPTRVGNSNYQSIIWIFETVHPHACGELGGITGMGFNFGGSSPRVWGTQRIVQAKV
ncbi:putative CRISPR associated hypothetical protein [Methanosarcina sp. WWM596]|nr:putative CRISPR associated hypothetical protein [Methanosarcina sp. WWM596]